MQVSQFQSYNIRFNIKYFIFVNVCMYIWVHGIFTQPLCVWQFAFITVNLTKLWLPTVLFTVLCQIYTWQFKASDKNTMIALSYSQFHDKNTPTNILYTCMYCWALLLWMLSSSFFFFFRNLNQNKGNIGIVWSSSVTLYPSDSNHEHCKGLLKFSRSTNPAIWEI